MKQPLSSFRRAISASLCAVLVSGTIFNLPAQRALADSDVEEKITPSSFTYVPGLSVIEWNEEENQTVCREASTEERELFSVSQPAEEMNVLSSVEAREAENAEAADEGLNIILRGTAQLNNFPQARDAFIRAANIWKSFIKTPITIIVDVDFGPTRFGTPYPRNVLGSTNPQVLLGTNVYPGYRQSLIDSASSDDQQTLFRLLPADAINTVFGSTRNVSVPTSVLRAIGIFPPVANPQTESVFGPPPSVGFNSVFRYDFDPSDGITSNATDFEAVAVHEIGHALGFISDTGLREFVPNYPNTVSNWDLFRTGAFSFYGALPNLPRVTSVFSEADFTWIRNGQNLNLGMATGGDGTQPSHWKHEFFTRKHIGIMDPVANSGFRYSLTVNDLAAIEAFGFKVDPNAVKNLPVISSFSASLDGDAIRLRGAVLDGDKDPRRLQLIFYDQNNFPIVSTGQIAVPFDSSGKFEVTLFGLDFFPEVTSVTVYAIDSKANRTPSELADFSQPTPGGGPVITDARLNFQSFTITGNLFDHQPLQVEINGIIVAPPLRIQFISPGRSFRIVGPKSALGLFPGPNRIRVRSGGKWSNIFVLNIAG
jgi:hypothetical protein